ncbi:MAG: carbohydrate ABC transporter permease [Chloroflexota bacterium]
MASASATPQQQPIPSFYQRDMRKFALYAMVTLFTSMILVAFLTPFAYMFLTSFKTKDQIIDSATGSVLPVSNATITYEGEELPLLIVDMPDGTQQELALLNGRRRDSTFVDPNNLDAEPIEWEGRWRTLKPVTVPEWHPENYAEAWDIADFPRLMFNTVAIAFVGLIGTLISCVMVAYAFARFPIPGKSLIFLVLISTIILPRQVMLVPLFAFFSFIGWTGTWLPLIVPHFFANAYNVFLLRQYFLQLPKDLDEAAMMDGANPVQILLYVIVPQSWPVIISVALFHLVFAWNDYFEPLIYTLGNPSIQPIAVGIQQFNFRYSQQPQLIQATALLGMLVPVILFFLAQRFFMRGVVITGVEK